MQCVPTVAPVPCALCELSTAVVCCACYLLSRHTHTQGTLFLSNMSLCVWAAEAWCAGCMPPPPLHGCSPTKGVATAGAPRSLLLQPRRVTCAADGPIVPGTRCSPLLVYLENHPGTPSSATFFPCGMQLFCFSSGRGSRHRSLSTFLPLGRHHFPVCFYKPGCKAMGTQKLAVHVRSSACAGT